MPLVFWILISVFLLLQIAIVPLSFSQHDMFWDLFEFVVVISPVLMENISHLQQKWCRPLLPVTLIILVTWLPRCAYFNIFIVWGHSHFSLNYYLPHTEDIAIAILNKALAVNWHSILHSNNFTVNCPSFRPSHALDITWSRTPQKMEAPIDCQTRVRCYRGLFFHWTLPSTADGVQSPGTVGIGKFDVSVWLPI